MKSYKKKFEELKEINDELSDDYQELKDMHGKILSRTVHINELPVRDEIIDFNKILDDDIIVVEESEDHNMRARRMTMYYVKKTGETFLHGHKYIDVVGCQCKIKSHDRWFEVPCFVRKRFGAEDLHDKLIYRINLNKKYEVQEDEKQ